MIGISEIAVYLPNNRVSNYSLKEKFNIDDFFIEQKLGVKYKTIKDNNQKASDLCIEAFKNLEKKINIDKSNIDCCVVVTQNPDYNIPHTSAIVHGKLGLKDDCACFDISLGCSGYVYALSVITSFMKNNNLKHGILFTADPYSEIIDENDKNTSLLFGDAATITYITDNPEFFIKDVSFGTYGKEYKALIKEKKLLMNGRTIFNFTATKIPAHVKKLLEKNNFKDEDIDIYLFHPGSKYIIDTIVSRLKIPKEKVPFEIYDYGNTVSSSIPIMLEKRLHNHKINRMVISGYGVGLSWASSIIERNIKYK